MISGARPFLPDSRQRPTLLLLVASAGAFGATSLPPCTGAGETILVEAESFDEPGGWKLDTQFIESMGSPYLLAHGLGRPVDDAVTTVEAETPGSYRLWVRTLDWVARWDAPGEPPGRFQVLVDGSPVGEIFGDEGAGWHWEDGGTVDLGAGPHRIALRDLTGFDGRCDALLLTRDPDLVPDNASEPLPASRRKLLGLSGEPEDAGPFDLVVVGGGYAGSCAAISAARMGLSVALIQNRGVLGGNGSSEVRVWAMGNTPPGLYPVGDIVNEFADSASKSPGRAEEFEDAKKERIVRAEPNISLFLHHHAIDVEMAAGDPPRIEAVVALDVKGGSLRRFRAPLFADCTGHGFIGMWAGADREMIPDGRMGMSNMWAWANEEAPVTFPEISWALPLGEDGFPYPRDFHAQWFWESGFDKHPIDDLEAIRDWNLRAAFGAWNAIKNKGAYADRDPAGAGHANARMTWLAYIGGTRETQQLLGDVVLTEEDIVTRRPFPDGCVLTTWSIDLHYPKEQYARKFPDNPFISIARHGKGVDRKTGYPVPYRCFYSRNIDNLFMAGRNISVTHEALGTIRVMKTCGMMGVVVGRAAAVATEHGANPRGVYQSHLDELIDLLELPGRAHRRSLDAPFVIPEPPPVPAAAGGIDPASLPGTVVDNRRARIVGDWTSGDGVKGFVGTDYLYAGAAPGGDQSVIFETLVPKAGEYDVRIAWRPHENRCRDTIVAVLSLDGRREISVDQTAAPAGAEGFAPLGRFRFEPGRPAVVIVTNRGTTGFAVADAVQFVPVAGDVP